MQIHIPNVVQGRGGGGLIEHSLEVMKIFFPQWKALDLLCQQDEVHFRGGGVAGGPSRHQQ